MKTYNEIFDVPERDKNRKIINSVCDFLKVNSPTFYGETLQDNIRELCVSRLCKSIGLRCDCNFKSDFLYFFSSFVGEAVAQILDIKIHIANDITRLFRHDGVNLVETAKSYLNFEEVDEAFIDIFNVADKYKYLIPRLKD